MSVTNPKVISALVSCSPKQLPKTAGQHGFKAAIASVVREHWICRITGRCVRCGTYIKKGECPKCHTAAPPSLDLLEQLDPKTPLINGQCSKCQKPVVFKAGYILKVTKKKGTFRPHGLCSQCLRASRAPKKKQEPKVGTPAPKKVVETPVKNTVKVPTTPQKAVHVDNAFRNRPFEALKGLKIENLQA